LVLHWFQKHSGAIDVRSEVPRRATCLLLSGQMDLSKTVSEKLHMASFGHLFCPDLDQAIFELRYSSPKSCQI
jgi:hypothetical protein